MFHMHTGRIVFHIMRMKQKWTVAFNGTKQAQVAAQCIVSKAVMCGVHIDVEFQGKSCEFRVDYSEALPYTEIAVVDNGLSREEALDGMFTVLLEADNLRSSPKLLTWWLISRTCHTQQMSLCQHIWLSWRSKMR